MTHIKVAVRVRPLLQREIGENTLKILTVENEKTVAVTNVKVPEQHAGDSRERIRRFTFDFCFDENSSQNDVFQAIEHGIGNAFKQRYHTCILTYGQSSSGKTHTMTGFPHDPGLAPRICEKLWEYLDDMAGNDAPRNIQVGVSVFWWTNETINIWTHLVPILLFQYFTLRDLFGERRSNDGAEKFILVCIGLAAQVALAGSVTYHIFICRPTRFFKYFLFFDLIGANITITTMSLSLTYFIPWRTPFWFYFHEFNSLSLFCLNVLTQFPTLTFTRKVKVIVLMITQIYAVIPFGQLYWNNPGSDPCVNMLITKTMHEFGVVTFSFLVYVLRMPERLVPKKFDFLGHSHQWWHIGAFFIFYNCHLEIYNEKVQDLLRPTDKSPEILKIRQHPKKGPYVQGLTEHYAADSITLLQLLARGSNNRRVAPTCTNSRSSRSHSVFIINFEGVKLTLVDLAGSERAGNSGPQFKEGANINKSLVALGNVISALAECSTKEFRRRFIPYRDSVLTWLLKDILGGNSDTFLIATISPSKSCFSETVNTLRFGQRAKLIVSVPVVNEDPNEKTIRELRAEIFRLKDLLKSHAQVPSMAQSTEELIPVVEFKQGVQPHPKLRRTFSVDHGVKKTTSETTPSRKYQSEETLTKNKKPTVIPPKKKTPTVEAKVDSIRRNSLKPRSQIVAAVTHRLYAKTKKKEIGTDTLDLAATIATPQPPKELSICSNARLQLKELTRRALKAHRSKNEETQTDLFPVRRVKEMSTDVDDLEIIFSESRNTATSTCPILTSDKEVSCTLTEFAANACIVTKNCATQATGAVSFTKYLQEPKLEFFNAQTANPIYTNTVNINISHNYLDGKISSIGSDSLEQQICLSKPDLISNHDSLEAMSSKDRQISYANSASTDLISTECTELDLPQTLFTTAQSVFTPGIDGRCSITFPSVFAAEICHVMNFDTCSFFFPQPPPLAKPNVVEPKPYSDDCVYIIEPIVLKSIMKQFPEADLCDSLEYHRVNCAKKVRFKSKEERMMKAMSSFLEEATILMNNLSLEREYNVEINVEGLQQRKKPRKKRTFRDIDCQTYDTKCSHVQTDDLGFEMPVNKYELLLEDSCRRLQEKIGAASDCDVWGVNDDSIESNPMTFSDYGSLPRRRRCPPSAYLKKLITVRRQLVEASREELGADSDSSAS